MSDIKIEKSTVKNSISGDNNKFTIGKTGWFFTGFILPIVTGLIVNYFWNGVLCDLLNIIDK